MSEAIIPFSLKDAPALIERLLPVQKLSAEVYSERMSSHGQTLTSLGGYWKGRKPLILNKACILGCLLPATEDPTRDLAIFEKLMAMDNESFAIRWKHRFTPKNILATLAVAHPEDYFTFHPSPFIPRPSPWDWSNPNYAEVKAIWREDITKLERRRLEAQMLPMTPYREKVEKAKRPEEEMESVYDHIWDPVNTHLGTNVCSFPELIEQLGIMRFGHRPRVADTFSGSGQIPFEAARLGCDVYASDLNPVACMLTWGAFNVIGGTAESRGKLAQDQQDLVTRVQAEVDNLGVEDDGRGWRAKVFLYCVEARCPQSGWMVPLLPSLVVSKSFKAVAKLIPDPQNMRYEIVIETGINEKSLPTAKNGTVRTDGRGQDPYLIHTVNGTEYRTKISTLRGDYHRKGDTNGNRLRLWEKCDFKPRPDDIFQERLYCVQWMRPKKKGKGYEYEFRAVTTEDLERERIVEEFMEKHLKEWQAKGWVPDMRIEPGAKTDEPIRTRGWTHWHHLFNPRQLLVAGIVNRYSDARLKLGLTQMLNNLSRLTRWRPQAGGGGGSAGVFDNQALNTLFNYVCRATTSAANLLTGKHKLFPITQFVQEEVRCVPADHLESENDIYITDPPYGDAVKYEEIFEFFISWLRKNPPPEFADWTWDSRRSLAIKGAMSFKII